MAPQQQQQQQQQQQLGPVTALKRLNRCGLGTSTETEWILGVGVGHLLELWREDPLCLLGTVACLPAGQFIHGIETSSLDPAPPAAGTAASQWLVVFGGRHLCLCHWPCDDAQLPVRCITYAADAWILAVSEPQLWSAPGGVVEEPALAAEASPRSASSVSRTREPAAGAGCPASVDRNATHHHRVAEKRESNDTASLRLYLALADGRVLALRATTCSNDARIHHIRTCCSLERACYWSAAFSPTASLVAFGTADGSILVQALASQQNPTFLTREASFSVPAFEPKRSSLSCRRYQAHRGPIYGVVWARPFLTASNGTISRDSIPAGSLSNGTGPEALNTLWLCSCGDDRTVQCFRVQCDVATNGLSGSTTCTPVQAVDPVFIGVGECGASSTPEAVQVAGLERIALLRGHQARPWAVRAYTCPASEASPPKLHLMVASVGEDDTVRLWDAQRNCCLHCWRGHRQRNCWCLDLALAALSTRNAVAGPWPLLKLYSGGADGSVSIHTVPWPREAALPATIVQRAAAENPACPGRGSAEANLTSTTAEASVRQQLRFWPEGLVAAPPLPPLSAAARLSVREHARAMAVLANPQLLCISTSARRVLALQLEALKWTEVLHGDHSVDFMPACIAAAKSRPWLFLGSSHRQSTILALCLDLDHMNASDARSGHLLQHQVCWNARPEAHPVTLVELWQDRLLGAAFADGLVLVFDIASLLEQRLLPRERAPTAPHVIARVPAPRGIVQQPSCIHFFANLTGAACNTPKDAALHSPAAVIALLIGHRSGHVRLHPGLSSSAEACAELGCIQLVRPHDDRVSSIAPTGVAGDGARSSKPQALASMLCLLSMDGTFTRFALEYGADASRLRLVQCSREKCPSECEQGDCLWELAECAEPGDPRVPASPRMLFASGFRGQYAGVWRLDTAQPLFLVPCGGWRRPHTLYERNVPAVGRVIGFGFWKAGSVYLYERILQSPDGGCCRCYWYLPQRLRLQGSGMRIQGLVVLRVSGQCALDVDARMLEPETGSRVSQHWQKRLEQKEQRQQQQQQREQVAGVPQQSRATREYASHAGETLMYWIATASEDTNLDLYQWQVQRLSKGGLFSAASWERVASGSAVHFSGVLTLAALPWPHFEADRAALATPMDAVQDAEAYLLVSGGGSDTLAIWRVSAAGLNHLARYIRSRSRAPFAASLCRPSDESLARVTAVVLGAASSTDRQHGAHLDATQTTLAVAEQRTEPKLLTAWLLCGRSDGTLSLYRLQVQPHVDARHPAGTRAKTDRFEQRSPDRNWHTTMTLVAVRPRQAYAYPRALCSIRGTAYVFAGDTGGSVALYVWPHDWHTAELRARRGTLDAGNAPLADPATFEPCWEQSAFLAAAVNAVDGHWFRLQSHDWLLLVAGGDDQHFRFHLCNLANQACHWSSERIGRHSGALVGVQLRRVQLVRAADELFHLYAELWTWSTDRWLRCHELRLELTAERGVISASVTTTRSLLVGVGDPALLTLVPTCSALVACGCGIVTVFPEQA
jgi:hypothetical protein